MPALCQATIFTTDGVIDGGTYSDVTIESTATVDMTAGTVETMLIRQSGTLNYNSGTIEEEIYVRDSGTLNFEGATFQGPQGLSMYNGSILNFNDGLLSGTFNMDNYVEVTIEGGEIADTTLSSNGYANTIINDGLVDWDDMMLNGFSVMDIWGGTVNWLAASIGDEATLNIYGGDMSFENGFSLNNDAEFNVYYSDIIRHKPEDPYSQIIGYHLLDGSEFMLDQFTYSEIDQINFVPEPATLLLFGLGGLLLRRRS